MISNRRMTLALSAIALASGAVLYGCGGDNNSEPPVPPPAPAPTAAELKECCTPGDKDFPKVGGNLGNQNYSELAKIGKTSVSSLGGAWLNRVEGGLATGTNQSTTVVVDGVLYIESALGNVIAVDGKTGATKWKWTTPYGGITRRGAAVAKDLGLVYTVAAGNRLVALKKDTGEVAWIKQYPTATTDAGYLGSVQKVAIVYHNGRLHIGTNDGNRGAAFSANASTGEVISVFWGVPGPGEIGYDTWGGAEEQYRTGATPWIHPAIDPELNLVYWTFGNVRGGSSQDGSKRPGLNLFANSIVALDLTTGKDRKSVV